MVPDNLVSPCIDALPSGRGWRDGRRGWRSCRSACPSICARSRLFCFERSRFLAEAREPPFIANETREEEKKGHEDATPECEKEYERERTFELHRKERDGDGRNILSDERQGKNPEEGTENEENDHVRITPPPGYLIWPRLPAWRRSSPSGTS